MTKYILQSRPYVLSPIIFFVPTIIAAFCAGIFSKIYSRRKHKTRVPFRQIVKDFQETYLDPEYIPAITVFRVYVNVLTSISILAVDFPQYPRRYAKAETYGTGVMDLGGAAEANSLKLETVSPIKACLPGM
ncbi:hypothetical protein QYF61_024096 [Mycteria americana]|uniref:Uncharacterized protein n=1 Tax=Mycteria americana TaxID=33587 RepID=A0AAN7MVH2_MYCAM|nr:hypothetical protein QYF61_024096 [Mycteria americana]